ncbi:MAG: cadherin-like beta sandwich domain-containing protein, partial [Nitrospira sp.]|nr:cadherin-like beta sandwich domain-containing protein [Nitrospira sp.]
MGRDLIYFGQRFIVAILLALGVSSSGCGDSASVSEDVRVPLASLAVTPGTLQPGFLSNTTSYKVNAPTSADSVTVTASPKGSTVEMTINGSVTAAGQGRSISLGTPGSITTITIVLFSQATGSETTYTINVTRLLSSDNNLSALTVTPGTLVPAFVSDTVDYTVNVATAITSVTVSATKS